MCRFLKKKKDKPKKEPKPYTGFAWPKDGGPSDADYEKTSLEYQRIKNITKEPTSSFGEDSSMTP